MCTLALSAAFGAQLQPTSVTLPPGGSAVLVLPFSAESAQIAALQFDLVYDSSQINLESVPDRAPRSAAKSVYTADLNPNQRRIIIAGTNDKTLSDGPLLSIVVRANDSAQDGTSPIVLTSVLAVNLMGEPVPLSDVSLNVVIDGGAGSDLTIAQQGILNTASMLPGSLAPGEMITFLGSQLASSTATVNPGADGFLPTTASGVSVQFDGIPAPLLYVSPNQLNVAVPWEVAGKTETTVTITRDDKSPVSLTSPVVAATPAIFTSDGTGAGQALAGNSDATLNSSTNPAAAGSLSAIFLSGAGAMDPGGITGHVIDSDPIGSLRLPVSVSIDGAPANVLSVIPAFGSVSGIALVVFQIPPETAANPQANLSVQVGDSAAPGGVWLAVGNP